jgi:hypothetical protein
MKKTGAYLATGIIFLLTLVLFSEPALAQSHLGVHVGVNLDNEEPFIGASLQTRLSGNSRLFIYPSLDVYLIDNLTFLGISGDLGYRIPIGSRSIEPYVGGGLTLFYASADNYSNTDLDVNLMGGLLFNPRSRVHPFVEFRLFIGGGTAAAILGGVQFTI